jgi:hypothetical protein
MMLRQYRRNNLVPQIAAPRSTRTHTMDDDDLRISHAAEIVEVSVWVRSRIPAARRRATVELTFAPTQPFWEPHGRVRWRVLGFEAENKKNSLHP